jgi:hypothetical protein
VDPPRCVIKEWQAAHQLMAHPSGDRSHVLVAPTVKNNFPVLQLQYNLAFQDHAEVRHVRCVPAIATTLSHGIKSGRRVTGFVVTGVISRR